MADEEIATNGERAITRTGDRLRKAREAQGLSLADVAQRTRITQRHLRAVEESDFAELPGRTYVTGFARAYARAIGLSETEIASSVRRELEEDRYSSRPTYEAYEPTDPDRLPTKRLAITAAVIMVLLVSGYGAWRFISVEPDEQLLASQIRAADEASKPKLPAAAKPNAVAPIAADAPVVLTATGAATEVWIGFDDAEGKARDSRTLKTGESFQLPPEYVANYTLRTSRPQGLQITVGGRDVGSLGPADILVKNISLKVPDLVARADSNGTSKTPIAPPTPALPAVPPVANSAPIAATAN
jgi:transcriptional regulator with XRE-family HTH domain